jgi:hypothetical protein
MVNMFYERHNEITKKNGYEKGYKKFSFMQYNKQMIIKKYQYYTAIIAYTGWCGLGFIRGTNSYKYSHSKNSNNKYEKKEPYLYSDSIIHGLFGIIIYGNPALLPFMIHKEIYRLEINVRNLEDEKKNRYYNEII